MLVDLSPAATFIAYNYNTPVDAHIFEQDAKRILKEVEKECGWMYETGHTPEVKGRINFVIWSDVVLCPQCNTEMIFWDVAVNREKCEVSDTWDCPICATKLAKNPRKGAGTIKADRVWEIFFDRTLNQTIRRC